MLLFVHVALSLVGIATGFVVIWGLLNSKPLNGWTALFLATTIATSVTGFFFPIEKITPGIVVGIISLVVLALVVVARYRFAMAGRWRAVYTIGAVVRSTSTFSC